MTLWGLEAGLLVNCGNQLFVNSEQTDLQTFMITGIYGWRHVPGADLSWGLKSNITVKIHVPLWYKGFYNEMQIRNWFLFMWFIIFSTQYLKIMLCYITVCSHYPRPRLKPILRSIKFDLYRIVWRCSYCTETNTNTDSHQDMYTFYLYLPRCRAVWMHH